MSAIFGIRGGEQHRFSDEAVRQILAVTHRYGPDGTRTVSRGCVLMGFQSFRTSAHLTTAEQPCVDDIGNVAVLDGRIDNREQLAGQTLTTSRDLSDAEVLLLAFEKWGEECFRHIVGEWACAIWSERLQTLYLARDHAGTRTLFFRQTGHELRWGTYLETFFVESQPPIVDDGYIASFISFNDTGELTPYKEIKAVPPSHYVVLSARGTSIRSHWSWIPSSRIVYRDIRAYDEQFLHLFEQAVRRRIIDSGHVIAELSGGVDSTSIVCMTDRVVNGVMPTLDRIGTISYFDDTEPAWNERPYFSLMEATRELQGVHLEMSGDQSFRPLILPDRIYPYPGVDESSFHNSIRFAEAVGSERYRVILSGIGGDELLGGVPTPFPELADYLARANVRQLLVRGTKWSVALRQPLIRILRGSCEFLWDAYRRVDRDIEATPPWMAPVLPTERFVPLQRSETQPFRMFLLPSTLGTARTWWQLARTLPNQLPNLVGCYEYRFPYLDRDLVEFAMRLPREQLVSPGRRRFLMRRALRGIVPAEILERRRKAVISRSPITSLRDGYRQIAALFADSFLCKIGLISDRDLVNELDKVLAGNITWLAHLHRTIFMEIWLRSVASYVAMP